MFYLFRLCRKDEISFDIVAETGNIVAKNVNNVEATFDIVERIVQLVAFDNVAGTLLLVWTGLNVANLGLGWDRRPSPNFTSTSHLNGSLRPLGANLLKPLLSDTFWTFASYFNLWQDRIRAFVFLNLPNSFHT